MASRLRVFTDNLFYVQAFNVLFFGQIFAAISNLALSVYYYLRIWPVQHGSCGF